MDDVSVAVSPSVFMGLEQDGRDILWHTPQSSPAVSEMQDFDDDNARMGFDEVNSNADTIEFDYQTIRNSRRAAEEVIDDDGDDDVIYVRNYQRPDDERAPSNDAGNIRAVEAEDRAARAEEMLAERVHRTSCPVCTDGLLTSATIRYPCA